MENHSASGPLGVVLHLGSYEQAVVVNRERFDPRAGERVIRVAGLAAAPTPTWEAPIAERRDAGGD
jgi:hypothetical protein